MKAAEIVKGSLYQAKVNGKLTTVRVDDIVKRPGYKSRTSSHHIKSATVYEVTNLASGRALLFRSAQRFIRAAPAAGTAPAGKAPPAGPGYFGDGPDGNDPMRPDPAGIEVAPAGGDDRDDGPPADGPDPDQQTAVCKERSDEQAAPAAPPTLAERLKQQAGASAARALAAEQQAARAARHGPPHLVITARAGTGKTTTLVSALQVLRGMAPTTVRYENGARLTVPIDPSPQQRQVWDAIALSRDEAKSAAFVAFNKSIATELASRVPAGCDAMTLHSLGFKAVKRAFGNCRVDADRVPKLIAELLGIDARQLRRDDNWDLVRAAQHLTRLLKTNLVPLDVEDEDDARHVDGLLQDLADYYEIEMTASVRRRVFDLVPRLLCRCRDVMRDGTVDFDDMVWLPVERNLPVQRYNLLLVDEAQDLNRCQQALARKAGDRLVFCGDDRQAIYGFTGSDVKSLANLEEELAASPRGCRPLALTVTRRCCRAVVTEASRFVPDFEAHEGNPQGRVVTLPPGTDLAAATVTQSADGAWHPDPSPAPGHPRLVRDGDFVVCRVNAPIVGLCFRLLRVGVRASIQGRDIGAGLVATIRKLKAGSVPALVGAVDDWLHGEEAKEQAKRFPSEARLIALHDKADCIRVFCDGAATVDEVCSRIEAMFTADANAPGVRLSSIHKAKGLEAPRVFFYRPKGASCPHPMARTVWAQGQELNLCYVAITRAISELVYCS